jgi:chemotaxis protein methyltransferase CheR
MEMDLILCRNVLLYFDDVTIAAVARRLFDSLAKGGWLLTAATDPPLADHACFEVVVSDAGIAYRRPLSQPVAVAFARAETLAREHRFSTVTTRMENTPEVLLVASAAFKAADHGTVATSPRELSKDPAACALHLRALANLGSPHAVEFAEEAIQLNPLSVELYYLLANLRMIEGNYLQAVALLRKAIYLAPALAILHFTLGSLLERLGEFSGARRSLRRAGELAKDQPADEVVPLSDGEPAALLATATLDRLRALDVVGGK